MNPALITFLLALVIVALYYVRFKPQNKYRILDSGLSRECIYCLSKQKRAMFNTPNAYWLHVNGACDKCFDDAHPQIEKRPKPPTKARK